MGNKLHASRKVLGNEKKPYFCSMSERIQHIKNIISTMPETPGVYQYFNEEGTIIYVGKAKNLPRRLLCYFNKEHDSVKTNVLVKHIHDLKYIVVNTETDALLLENNLIKQYQPRYNILLKDGKTYPWLCITREAFPRVFRTRQVVRGAEYFGPYSNVYVLDTLLELIREIYPIRTCRLPLTPDGIAAGRFKVCLQYHIKNCKGCCEGLQSREDYLKMIDEIKEIAKGNSHNITDYLVKEMQKLAAELRFEEAQALKVKYDAILKYQAKTVITTTHDDNLDVYSYEEDEGSAYINMLHISKGSITKGFTIEYQKRMDEPKEEIFAMGILELRDRLKSDAKTLIVPFMPELNIHNVEFMIPKIGDKKKLLDLSYQNVRQYKVDKYKQAEKLNPEQRMTRLLSSLQKKLGMEKMPLHIECFDNSNISGSDAVAACVVFKKAKPSRKDYRKYIIKTVEGPDDYASMKEVVKRRYTRLINENSPLPDLIIADGGAGQMEMIRQALEEVGVNIPIAGLAKDDHHRTHELLFGFPPATIGLKPTEELFKFLTQIQDETHRVAISFHRDRRSKSQTASELDHIKGIGEKTKNELLQHFKSVKRIQNAEKDELAKIIGTNRASIIYNHFHPNLTL